MEWLFGSGDAAKDAAKLDAKLSASTAQGRSAPAREDDSLAKKRGNDHFKRREFDAAAREYSLGIDAQPTATLFSNRSVHVAAHSMVYVMYTYNTTLTCMSTGWLHRPRTARSNASMPR